MAERYGLAAADAFNLASAIRMQADEFVTTERSGRPMFRVKEIKVVTLHAAAVNGSVPQNAILGLTGGASQQ